jgi:hypothetical protein
MKGAAFPLILGTVLIALWYFARPPERPGFMPEPGLLERLFGGPGVFIAYHGPPGIGVAFLLAGTILVITGLLLATLAVIERRRRAKAEGARAPIKMLFPLVSFIFAALFIVILSPAIISIMINLRT